MGLFARRIRSESQDNSQEDINETRRIEQWIARVKHGAPISDAAFDEIYPDEIKKLSRVHWTPIEVIKRATQLLVKHPNARVLDVGSGVGKFCLVGAMVSDGRFHGIEQRKHFVDLANSLVSRYKLPRTTFIHGNFKEIDWSDYDAVYLFNPFQENKTPEQRLDNTVPLSRDIYRDYVIAAFAKLETLKKGARVVTYHGFGGVFPESFERKVSEWCYRGPLELWIKAH
jgi:hypothetical protein